jgi:hypothetical protein
MTPFSKNQLRWCYCIIGGVLGGLVVICMAARRCRFTNTFVDKLLKDSQTIYQFLVF